jgi:murein L,D-transpeptidase YcbB/YkuD
MARYEAMVAAGGWPNVPAGLTPDKQAPEVTLLRHRLAIEGYLPPDASTGEAWDDALTQAVKSFQTNMGLQPTGIPAGATLKALNVTAAERLQALRGSLRRLAGTTFGFGPRHVVVNIPSAAVEAIENGRVVRRYTAVVGDRAHRSPEIAARVQSINLNPTWTVPASIIKNEIIPQMRKNPHYLSKSKIRIFDGKGSEVDPQTMDWSGEKAVGYLFRQDAGAQNSLGSIRINMPNREAVYMHDTPSKRSFSADDRFLSHGCVRVQGVYDLAAWLLEETAGTRWDRMTLLAEASDGQSAEIKLSKSVPVIWVYLTAWAGLDGAMHFRPDVYGYDTFDADAIRAALN